MSEGFRLLGVAMGRVRNKALLTSVLVVILGLGVGLAAGCTSSPTSAPVTLGSAITTATPPPTPSLNDPPTGASISQGAPTTASVATTKDAPTTAPPPITSSLKPTATTTETIASATASITTTAPADPWPEGLTKSEIKDAKSALKLVDQYLVMLETTLADPAAKDWEPAIRKVSGDPAAHWALESVEDMRDAQLHWEGRYDFHDVKVTSVDGPYIEIVGCLDSTARQIVDRHGDVQQAVTEDPPGMWEATVTDFGPGYGWLVSDVGSVEPSAEC